MFINSALIASSEFPDLINESFSHHHVVQIALVESEGSAWRQHTRAYFSTKCPVVHQLLDWAESSGDTPIQASDVLAFHSQDFGLDPPLSQPSYTIIVVNSIRMT